MLVFTDIPNTVVESITSESESTDIIEMVDPEVGKPRFVEYDASVFAVVVVIVAATADVAAAAVVVMSVVALSKSRIGSSESIWRAKIFL